MTPPPTPPVINAPHGRSIKYSLARGDIFRWHFYLLRRNRVLTIFILIASLAMAWNDLRTPQFAAYSIAVKIVYTIFLIGFMFCFVGFSTMVVMSFTVMFKKFRGFLGEHELEIRDDGLVERTSFNESLHRWAGFQKIVRTRRYLYIYVTDNNVHMVPRHYFASKQEEQAFQDEIERHIDAV
jgi:hypothetical protein